jgi:molecular chaperone DnaK (HSP70)
MQPTFGGIDFGTSNSTVGVIEDGQPRLVPLEGEQVTLPSAVFFNFDDDRTYVGRRAIADYTDGVEGRLMRALKSVLGSSLVHEKTRIKKRQMAFTDIIGLFIAQLKTRMEAHTGQAVGLSCSVVPCSSSTTMPKPTGTRRMNWKGRRGRRAFATSPSSTSRSRPHSTMSARCSARSWP